MKLHEILNHDNVHRLINCDDWNNLSYAEDIYYYEIFVHNFKTSLNWNIISNNPNLSSRFLFTFRDLLDWNTVSMVVKLSIDILTDLFHFFRWEFVACNKFLTEDIVSHFDYMWSDADWIFQISEFVQLSEIFMRKYAMFLDWKRLCSHQLMSESFIVEFEHLINWKIVSNKQKLSTHFISIYYASIDFLALICNTSSHLNIDYTNPYIIHIKLEIDKYFKSDGRCFPSYYCIYNSFMSLIIRKIDQHITKISIIQKYWRICISNPSYDICKKRLYREFTDLIQI